MSYAILNSCYQRCNGQQSGGNRTAAKAYWVSRDAGLGAAIINVPEHSPLAMIFFHVETVVKELCLALGLSSCVI